MGSSRPLDGHGRAARLLVPAWVVTLSCLALGPALAPGYVLSYDMVWVPDLSLTRADVWGLGSSLPRAVPSDAVVAVLGSLIPQQLLQKALLLGALVAAGLGGAAVVHERRTAARMAAATLMVWNPFVAERLGLGHWPLLIAYAAVPWLILSVRGRRFASATPALAATALTPFSGVMGVIIAVATGRRRDAWRWLALGLAVNAPWIVASLASPSGLTSDAQGVDVFAARGRGPTPAWLEVVSLGGVWNAEVVPAFRETAVATVLSALFATMVAVGAVLLRRRAGASPLIALWVVGFAGALGGVVAPGALGWVTEHVPGGGLVRDGSRWVLLMVPFTVSAVAAVVERLVRDRTWRATGWVLALVAPIALVPDLAWGLTGQMRAVDYPDPWSRLRAELAAQDASGDLVSLPFSAFRAPEWNHGRPVLDPAGRFFDRVTITDDTLVVGTTEVAGEDVRAARIGAAIRAGDWDAVAADGVGFVVVDTSARGGAAAAETVQDLPVVTVEGPLRLLRVPAAVETRPRTGRVVAVGAGWVVALVTTGAAVAQIGRRRKSGRGR